VRALQEHVGIQRLELVEVVDAIHAVKLHADEALWAEVGPLGVIDLGERDSELRHVKGATRLVEDIGLDPARGRVKGGPLDMLPVL